MSWPLGTDPADPANPGTDAGPLAPGEQSAARSHVRCDGAGQDVVLAFPDDGAVIERALAIEGCRFDRDAGVGVFPFASMPEVVALAGAHGIGVPPQVQALVPAARLGVPRDQAVSRRVAGAGRRGDRGQRHGPG